MVSDNLGSLKIKSATMNFAPGAQGSGAGLNVTAAPYYNDFFLSSLNIMHPALIV